LVSDYRKDRQYKCFQILNLLVMELIGSHLVDSCVLRPILDLYIWLLHQFDQRFHHLVPYQCASSLHQLALKIVHLCFPSTVSSSSSASSSAQGKPLLSPVTDLSPAELAV